MRFKADKVDNAAGPSRQGQGRAPKKRDGAQPKANNISPASLDNDDYFGSDGEIDFDMIEDFDDLHPPPPLLKAKSPSIQQHRAVPSNAQKDCDKDPRKECYDRLRAVRDEVRAFS